MKRLALVLVAPVDVVYWETDSTRWGHVKVHGGVMHGACGAQETFAAGEFTPRPDLAVCRVCSRAMAREYFERGLAAGRAER